MHRTSSTLISDIMIKLQELREAINGDDWSWMGNDEKFATVVTGMHIMHQMTKQYDPDHFDGDEVELINGLIDDCNDIICELTGERGAEDSDQI